VGGNPTAKSIPNYLAASTPQGLRRLMLLNNARKAMFFKYFNIQYANGQWYAWYFDELDSQSTAEVMGGR
jgi:hypothetical protein